MAIRFIDGIAAIPAGCQAAIIGGGGSIISRRLYTGAEDPDEGWSVFTNDDPVVFTELIYPSTVQFTLNAAGGPDLTLDISSPRACHQYLSPPTLTATAHSADITLDWTAAISGDIANPIDHYAVTKRLSPAGTVVGFFVLGDVLTYVDTSVSSGVTYYYTVTAFAEIVGSEISNQVSATIEAAFDVSIGYVRVPLRAP